MGDEKQRKNLMNPQLQNTLFNLANTFVMPFWILLIFAPHAKLTTWIFEKATLRPMHFLAVIYAALVIPGVLSSPQSLAVLSQPTLEGVQQLLSNSSGAAAGWVHYLCFDLFVGAWIWKTAREKKHRFIWVSPVLFFVLMLGPFGWLIFEAGSRVAQRSS